MEPNRRQFLQGAITAVGLVVFAGPLAALAKLDSPVKLSAHASPQTILDKLFPQYKYDDLQVALLDESGRMLDGYGMQDCHFVYEGPGIVNSQMIAWSPSKHAIICGYGIYRNGQLVLSARLPRSYYICWGDTVAFKSGDLAIALA